MKKAEVDLGKCQGHGKCYMVAPEMFEPIDDEAHAGFADDPIADDDGERMDQVQRAVDSCPEYAITIIDAGETA